MELIKLKSGSDIRGTALDILGGAVSLDPAAVRLLARGFARYFSLKKVAVGHDSRLSADMLSAAAAEGLMDEGCSVKFYGLSSTPAMFMATVLDGCDGSIMLTASHHPKDKNGMKFFVCSGGVSKEQLENVIRTAEQIGGGNQNKFAENAKNNAECCKNYISSDANIASKNDNKNSEKCTDKNKPATFEKGDFLELYCRHLRSLFTASLGDKPLKGLKIAVDAGNGSAGFYATRILQPLGADISGSQFLQPDGNFPFHAPNPEDKAAMASISGCVTKTNSDLGVIFDTDGDRCAIVTSSGKEINRNRLIALISAIILREQKGATIVTDSVTSEGLRTFIESRGGKHIRYKRGYQNVISYAKQLCEKGENAPLAIETSGHAALKENYFLDDGAYLVARLIIEAVRLKRENKTLDDLIADLREPIEEADIRIKITGEDFRATATEILSRIESLKTQYRLADDSFEGVRVYTDDGWFMARLSVHDPVVPINIEADKKGGVRRICSVILDLLSDIKNADFSPLQAKLNSWRETKDINITR